jgi:protoporphyrinogen/coproporphyrinogen III oxidase
MRVVVIGGGIAGLAAAHALSGADVTVLESSDRVGGKLRTSEIAGVDVDEGAESFLVRVPEGLALATAVGLDSDVVNPASTSASLWARGRLRPIPPRTVLGVPSSLSSVRGVLSPAEIARASLDLVLPEHSSDSDESVAVAIAHRLGPAVVDRLVEPLLGGVYAGRADALSFRATMPQLVAHEGSLIRAARHALPAPDSDSGSGAPSPVFATVVGGLGRLAEAAARASGATIRTGVTVREIRRDTNGFRLVVGSTIASEELAANAVIVAVPAPAAAKLLVDVCPAASTELSAIEMASVALVTLAFRRGDLLPPSGSGYLVPPSARRPVKGVTIASAKWAHLDVGDVTIVRCSFGRYGDAGDLQRDDADLVDAAVDELGLTGRVVAAPIARRISRWGGGLPQYAVGHLDRVQRIRSAVASVPGLAVCGAAYEGVGIPACIRTGQQAADRVKTFMSEP